MESAKTGRPTIIRGIAIVAGSTVYTMVGSARMEAEHGATCPIEIKSHVVKQTNGTTFAFTRGKNFYSRSAEKGPYNWVQTPENFFVTEDEAKRALAEERAMIPMALFDKAFALEVQAKALMDRADALRKQGATMAAALAASGTTLLDLLVIK